jgi:hypothetical protein
MTLMSFCSENKKGKPSNFYQKSKGSGTLINWVFK